MEHRYGVNMRRYCREHEALLRGRAPSRELLAVHLEKLRWLQHERLVHLIVTVMVTVAELLVTAVTVLHPDPGLLLPVLMVGLAVLLGFYYRHYFFLENTVQRWYLLADALREALAKEE